MIVDLSYCFCSFHPFIDLIQFVVFQSPIQIECCPNDQRNFTCPVKQFVNRTCGGIQRVASVEGRDIVIWNGTNWNPRFLVGVNLGEVLLFVILY